MRKICHKCKKEVEKYCFYKNGEPICGDCIRNLDDGSVFCGSCGKWVGVIQYLGKGFIVPVFYINISAACGSGMGTVALCADCMPQIPDRMGTYILKVQGCISVEQDRIELRAEQNSNPHAEMIPNE